MLWIAAADEVRAELREDDLEPEDLGPEELEAAITAMACEILYASGYEPKSEPEGPEISEEEWERRAEEIVEIADKRWQPAYPPGPGNA